MDYINNLPEVFTDKQSQQAPRNTTPNAAMGGDHARRATKIY